MSQLEKLAIQGVRSFDPDKPQIIKFCPLTLILGVNGAGKTTIIEALRYVTSGEAPPGTEKGKTWIYDPRMQRSGKIRAQVKLKFRTKDDEVFTTTRSMEMITKVTNGKVLTTMKTLDMMIKRENSQDAILSSKHGETGVEMLSLMGVSKAVLTNVIFCHQEDNCWPLSEGKVLKEKFDQIFGSMGYVKSLEKIRKYRADKMKEVNTLRATMKMFEEVKLGKSKLEDDIKRHQKELETQRRLRTEFDAKLQPIKQELQSLAKEETQLMKVRTEISKINGILSEKLRMKSSLEKQVGEKFDGTLEELMIKIDDFTNNLDQKKDELKKIQEEIRTNNSVIMRSNAQINAISGKMGRLQQQEEMIEKSVKVRNDFVLKVNEEYKFCDFETVDLNVIEEVVSGLNKILNDSEKSTEVNMQEIEEKMRRTESSIEEIKLKKAKDSQSIKLKQETQSVREQEVRSLLEKLRTVESAANEVVGHSNEIESIAREIQEKLSEMRELSDLQSKVSDLKMCNISLENYIMDFKRTYNDIIQDLASNVTELKRSMKEYDERIPQLQSELNTFRKELKSVQNEGRSKEDKVKEQLRKVEQLNSQVSSSASSGDSSSFESLKEQMKELESKVEKANNLVPEVAEKERKLAKECSDKKTVVREFEDKKSLLTIWKEIDELKEKISNEEEQLTSKDFSSLLRKKSELEGQGRNLEGKIAACRGKETVIHSEVDKNEKELKSKKYREVDEQYKKAAIDYVTADMACNDLNTYYKVLDRAVSTFHVRRMADVNNQISHFWRSTYQGSDIDTIRIACDDAEGSTAEKRKQYNYKVVMVKNSVEMDMRGRCSAGQKVLASLVIRIALAQVFASDCAILTLDEPTTNLDKHNAEALSRAISGIVEEVKGKLQLVIITHDPDFLNYLNEEYSEFYYGVTKENGFSRIDRHNISELK